MTNHGELQKYWPRFNILRIILKFINPKILPCNTCKKTWNFHARNIQVKHGKVAPLTLVSKEAYPAVHSIIFGEGVFNDVVSILLFSSVLETRADTPGIGSVVVNVAYFFFTAGLAGIAGGFFNAYTLRRIGKYLEPKLQALWVILLSYSNYVVTEAFLNTSAIFSVFVCMVVYSTQCGGWGGFLGRQARLQKGRARLYRRRIL